MEYRSSDGKIARDVTGAWNYRLERATNRAFGTDHPRLSVIRRTDYCSKANLGCLACTSTQLADDGWLLEGRFGSSSGGRFSVTTYQVATQIARQNLPTNCRQTSWEGGGLQGYGVGRRKPIPDTKQVIRSQIGTSRDAPREIEVRAPVKAAGRFGITSLWGSKQAAVLGLPRAYRWTIPLVRDEARREGFAEKS